MGANQSTQDVQDAVNDVQQGLNTPGQAERGIVLYKFVRAGNGGQWEKLTSSARPRFYDAKEDTRSSKAEWFLEVDGGDVDSRVDQDLAYVVDLKQRRVTFTSGGDIYALRFPTEEQYRAFAEELNDKTFFNTYGVENDEAARNKELGEDFAGMFFAKNTSQVSEPMEVEDAADREPVPELTPEKMKEKKVREDDEDNEAIQGLVMGAGENNYIVRGRQFDVLQNVAGGGVVDKGVSFTITPIRGGAGSGTSAACTPSRVLLARGETRMNLLTPEHNTQIQHVDIETGKVVSTWKFQKNEVDIPQADICHEDKAGQLDDRSTFLGFDRNRLCKWDMRTAGGRVMESPIVSYNDKVSKDFARGTNFSCMATSGNGFVAVGSQDGKIRLYSNKTLTRANTAIPGLGAPITAIDVTYDGKWVLATTDKYLMVVRTTYTDDKGKDSNGFTSKMGGRGAMPRLLRLKPEDIAKTGNKPFAKGKFTWVTESGTPERWIVANCGKFSVIWNFGKVKGEAADSLSYGGLPTCMEYIMTAKEEDVVDAAFVHPKYSAVRGRKDAVDQAALVVATPHRLFNMGS